MNHLDKTISSYTFRVSYDNCNAVLTFESVDEILWCRHSNETSLAVLCMAPFVSQDFRKRNLGFFFNFDLWHSSEFKRLKA